MSKKMGKNTALCLLIIVFAFLGACGPSAEEIAKEQERIKEEITALKDEIWETRPEAGKSLSELYLEELRQHLALAQTDKEKAVMEDRINDAEVKLAGTIKENAENAKKHEALIKKLKDEYGVEYKPKKRQEAPNIELPKGW